MSCDGTVFSLFWCASNGSLRLALLALCIALLCPSGSSRPVKHESIPIT